MLWHGLERGRVREEENDKGASGPREPKDSVVKMAVLYGKKKLGGGKSLGYQVEVKRNVTGTE